MSFQGRESVSVENDALRVTVLREGGHIAEILHKKTGVNPMWMPPWHSGEPSTYDSQIHPEYGLDSESKLLRGIMGHNLCLDIFGPPSVEEAAAGLTVHGESSVVRYEIETHGNQLKLTTQLPLAGLSFQRNISLDGKVVNFKEQVFNQLAMDRAFAWTQHVTLGPPFLSASTHFSIPAEKSRTFEDESSEGGSLSSASDFTWPYAPLSDGGVVDLRIFGEAEPPFSRFTTHLMKPGKEAGFAAFSPEHKLAISYWWTRDDFPWLGMWQENRMRQSAPWNGRSVTCGLEFGVSPFPETRRQMIERAPLFGTPVYRWLSALGRAEVSYQASLYEADDMPEDHFR